MLSVGLLMEMDAEGAELLEPCSGARVAVTPFAKVSSEQAGDVTARHSDRLTVVYDRRFDRFFLAEEPQVTAPLPSVSKTRPKRAVAASVQWQDVLVPPRSISKRVDPLLLAPLNESTTPDRSHWNTSQDADLLPATEKAEHNTAPFSTDSTAPAMDEVTTSVLETLESQPTTALIDSSSRVAVEVVDSTTKEDSMAKSSPRAHFAEPIARTDSSGHATNVPAPRAKLVAAVQLLRSLRRFIHRRRLQRSLSRQTNPGAQTVERVPEPVEPTLQLDLSKMAGTSPQRRSPKKRARPTTLFPTMDASSHCLHVDNQHEHSVRWQGEPIHISVSAAAGTDKATAPTTRPRLPAARNESTLHHVFHLRDLARIRPRADGFRFVNGDNTFEELTSPSSSSSSEDEAPLESSSEEEMESYRQYVAGDRVLFAARHRWFHGAVLKRIRQSCFYDIRAANGSIFEAVPARCMRLFDGHEEPERFEFHVGDRVLWRRQRDDKQTYKARITLIRPCQEYQRQTESTAYRYDLELLTGRVVKRIPYRDLRPLRR